MFASMNAHAFGRNTDESQTNSQMKTGKREGKFWGTTPTDLIHLVFGYTI